MSRFSKLKSRNEQNDAFKRENFLTTQEELVQQKVAKRRQDRYNLVSDNFRGFSGAFNHLSTMEYEEDKLNSLFYAIRSVLQSKNRIKGALFSRDERAKSEDFIESHCTIEVKRGPGYDRLLNNREQFANEAAKRFLQDESLLAIEADYQERCFVYFTKKNKADPVWAETKVVGEETKSVTKTVKKGKKEEEVVEQQVVEVTGPWDAYAKLNYSLM